MKKFLIFTIFIFILIIAIAVRFYKLGDAPAGLYIDEAGQGYNAYSILKTGKDEFGKPFPLVFRSFIDFKTPVYIYLIVPFITLFDLTSFTVRFPSFIFSVLTFPILFLLLKKISPKKIAISIALLTTLLLAISPWHVVFSRTNFECNVALFFFLTGVYLFYKGLDKPVWFIAAALIFAIAIPSYHSQRIITPFFVLLLFLRHREKILASKTRPFSMISIILGFVILFPTLSVSLTPGFLARASGLNIFSHARQMPAGFVDAYEGPLAFLVNGSWFLSTWEFASLYVSYFSPRNMFILGDSGLRDSYPELATFFVWQFPFYLYGLYILIKNKSLGELRFFIISLLLISPIPAAVTRDPYATIRSLPLVVPQTIIIGLAMLAIWEKIKFRFYHIMLVFILLAACVYSILKLYSSAIILNEHFRGFYWDYGWEEVVKVIKKDLDPNLPIVVDNTRFEPYSQIVFFLKYPPEKYQKENYEVSLVEYYTNMNRNRSKVIGNITTRAINWEEDLVVEQYLIGDSLAISSKQIEEHELTLIKDILYPDGSIAYKIVKIPKKLK